MKFVLQRRDDPNRKEQAIMLGGLFLLLLIIIGSTFAPAFLIPRCHFKHFTGIPCGGCGTFRGLDELISLNIMHALRSQPLMITLFLCVTAYCIYTGLAFLLKRPVLTIRHWNRKDTLTSAAVFGILFFANWMFLIADGR